MTPTKLLIGQILIVFAIVFAGVWFATEWAAAKLAFQPELGAPWARIGEGVERAARLGRRRRGRLARRAERVRSNGAGHGGSAWRAAGTPAPAADQEGRDAIIRPLRALAPAAKLSTKSRT